MADERARDMRRFTAFLHADLPQQDFYQRLTIEQRRIIYEGIVVAAHTVLEQRAKEEKAAAIRAKRRERYATRRAQAHAVAEAEAILFAHA